MADYIYDRETDTLYVLDEDGMIWFRLFLILAIPFCVAACWLMEYAQFVSDHPGLYFAVFLGFSVLFGNWLYHKRSARHPKAGILAAALTLLPVWAGQMFHAVPYLLAKDSIFAGIFEWLVVTFFTVGISFLVLQLSLLFRDGRRHLGVAAGYLLVALCFIL